MCETHGRAASLAGGASRRHTITGTCDSSTAQRDALRRLSEPLAARIRRAQAAYAAGEAFTFLVCQSPRAAVEYVIEHALDPALVLAFTTRDGVERNRTWAHERGIPAEIVHLDQAGESR